MSRGVRVQRTVAAAMLVIGVVLLLVAATFSLISIRHTVPVTYGTQVGLAVWSTGYCAYSIIGWLIVRNRPSNLIGWLFLWVGALAGFHLASVAYSNVALQAGLPLGVEAAWVGNWGWNLWIGAIVTLIAPLFPDGRPVSRRLWPLIGVIAAGLLAGAVSSAFLPAPLEVDPRLQNPFASTHPIVGLLGIGLAVFPLGVVLGIVSLIVRYRRGDPTMRLQLRWFLMAILLVGLGFILVFVGPGAPFMPGITGLVRRIFEDVVNFGWAVVAMAVGVAVLRYRLYAIDSVINRALVYGALTAVLGALYGSAVVVFQTLLRPLRGEGDFAIAASTLLVAVAFVPLRRRVQAFVDRRFYRARYDAQRLVAAFAGRMRDQLDLDDIAMELEGTARSAVQPSTASVWLRAGTGRGDAHA